MAEIGETERIALENNVRELVSLRVKPEKEAAEKALKLAADSVGMLFTGRSEPQGEDEKLAHDAGKAQYDAGSKIHIWHPGKEWDVWIDKQEVGSEKPPKELEEQRDLIQQACEAGLKDKLETIAGQLAVADASKVKVETRLLRLAGAQVLSQSQEKSEVFRARLKELRKIENKARHWTVVNRTNLDQTPEMKVVDETIRKVTSR